MFRFYLALASIALLMPIPCPAQTAHELYQELCSDCHGRHQEGGLGPSLVDDKWLYGGSDEAIGHTIRQGKVKRGMHPFANSLNDKQLRGLIIFLREQASRSNQNPEQGAVKQGLVTTNYHDFKLTELARFDGIIWAIEQQPKRGFLVTIRNKQLWQLDEQGRKNQIKDLPPIWRKGQGGLMDVALHPDYQDNDWVYLAYSEGQSILGFPTSGMTTLARGKVKAGKWQEHQTLFSAESKDHTSAWVHFGSRILFKGSHVYFTIGDRGIKEQAQSLAHPNGKVHRLFSGGGVPEDNPFSKAKYPSIWSYGHRNPQGLTLNPDTGEIWSVEHGPRGGDELNLIQKGLNYGWPEITHGMNYDGTPITAHTAKEGMEQPQAFWVPSLAVSAVTYYSGDIFKHWQGHLLLASLAAQELRLLKLKGNQVSSQEILLKDQGRIRDVIQGQDGFIYLALENSSDESSRIVRLEPVNK